MSKAKKESFFWTSYSDLMTSLFFVMLVLFVLVVALLHNKISEQALKLEEFEKIEEIKRSLNNIDSTYFAYNPEYKKHILKISVEFPTGQSNISKVEPQTLSQLTKAGIAIRDQIIETTKSNPEIQYLLIIEGQASKDYYMYNYELSYSRALALRNYWTSQGIKFGNNCEVLISGSGTEGKLRETDEKKNQRFLIHIIPKTGVIENKPNLQ